MCSGGRHIESGRYIPDAETAFDAFQHVAMRRPGRTPYVERVVPAECNYYAIHTSFPFTKASMARSCSGLSEYPSAGAALTTIR